MTLEPTVDSPPAVSSVQRFKVTFGERGALGIGYQPNDSLGFAGEGALEIDGETLFVSGAGRGLFWNGTRKRQAYPLSGIRNVVGAGGSLHIGIPTPENQDWYVECELADAADMDRILALLPKDQTPQFAEVLIEQKDFYQRLYQFTGSPRVVPTLIGLNLLVFVLLAGAGAGFVTADASVAAEWGSNFGPMTMAQGQWWRLWTANYIHFGLLHFVVNMLSLAVIGPLAERLFGSWRFLLLYTLAGIAGSVASLLWNPLVNGAGASGAIFGVLGGLLAFIVRPSNGVPRSVMVERRKSLLMIAGYNLLYGAAHPGIDNAAHLGGLVGGLVVGLMLARPLDETRQTQPRPMQALRMAALASLLLGAAIVPLARPSDEVRARQAFELALSDLQARETEAVQATQGALAILQTDPTAYLGASDALLRRAAPRWRALQRSVAAPRLAPGDPQAHMQALLVRYLDGRARYCELLGRGMREGDDGLVSEASAAGKDADDAIVRLNRELQAKGHG